MIVCLCSIHGSALHADLPEYRRSKKELAERFNFVADRRQRPDVLLMVAGLLYIVELTVTKVYIPYDSLFNCVFVTINPVLCNYSCVRV